MDMPVSSIMERIVNPVDMDDTIEEVERILNTHGFSSVPVVDAGGAVLGIITSRDLLHFHAAGRDPKTVSAWEICTYRPFEVSPDTPIGEVAELMVTHKIHHVVVATNGSMKGIVSSLDFVRMFVPKDGS